jgi:hypothetical protein
MYSMAGIEFDVRIFEFGTQTGGFENILRSILDFRSVQGSSAKVTS